MLSLEERPKLPVRTQSAPPGVRRKEDKGRAGLWSTPLLLPQEAVPAPTERSSARSDPEEECAVFGLSTTVANERLVEQIEAVVGEFLELVKVVTWRSRLSFLQAQEGAIAPLIVLAFVIFAVLTGDTSLIGEVLLILPFHLLAWYISFRLPRAEQLRAIAKVQDCVQRFVTSDDAFTQADTTPYDQGCTEAVPPSALCISVLRDRGWRQLPYNMVVEGDVFKLREGETFPCQAERLIIRPQGAVPSGQVFRSGDVFAPTGPGGGAGEDLAVPSVGSFRAHTTACVPLVRKFLQSAQRSSAGRMDTVFFELATLVRGRLKKLSLTGLVCSLLASGLWLLQPAVMEQSIKWHLHRFLLPLRLVLCLLPLLPAILLQVTDIWGNARIQSLFQWHAGLSDEERSNGAKPKGRAAESCEDEQSIGSGDLDASRVPLQWQLKELFGILGQGLEGQANLMHTLNSTTVVCFCDREGLLTDTCTSVAEVCLCSSRRPRKHSVISEGACSHSRAPSETAEEEQRAQRSHRSPSKRDPSEALPAHSKQSCERAPVTPEERAESSKAGDNEEPDVTFHTLVLDVQSDSTAQCGLRFEDADWRAHLSALKPLGLSMAVSRQPRELFRPVEGPELFNNMAGDLLHATQRGPAAAMHDCCCNMSQLIGFRDDVVGSFSDVKFCMEFCRPHKLQALPPHQRSEISMAPEQRVAEASPNTVATHARPHTAWRAAPSPPSGSEGPSPLSVDFRDGQGGMMTGQLSKPSHEMGNNDEEIDSTRRPEDEGRDAGAAPHGPTNFSQTLLTWFVEDPRDGSYQMFCKAKPKRLLPRCTHYFDGHEVLPLTEEDKQCLTRLVLQWKASGLAAVAYSFRPLTTQAEIDIPMQLDKNTYFCVTEDGEGGYTFAQAGRAGEEVFEKTPHAGSPAPAGGRLAKAWQELQCEQVLLGMAGVKLCASVQMPSYAEALQTAGIRFQVYSVEGEKRTRTMGSQLGLETGWNCLISLEPNARQVKNMMGQVVLPSGIAKIRRHVKEVDNVPLLVSLYSRATPWRAQQMISIMQEHAECVTCVGSALQPNFEIFRQASISVSVLVNSVPQCRRCFGRRAPRPAGSAGSDELLVNNMVNRAEFQLSADLTSLPCALQARHSFSNGEQRTLEVLFNAIKEARRCVDCILMVLIHYLCGAVELAVLVALQSLLCLPPPMEGFHVLAVLLLLLPLLSVCLLFNAASPQIMKELPLKKADEKTLAQPGRLMLLYALRSVPSAVVVVVAFLQDLHLLFSSHLKQALAHPARSAVLQEMCEGFSWTWWLSGRWPRCVKALHEGSAEGSLPPSPWAWEEGSCTLTHAQQWSAWLFVLYEVTLAFTFLDRYDSLVTRGPASNKVLNSVALVTLLVHLAVSCSLVVARCKEDRPEVLVPSVQQWLVYVAIWPVLAVLVSEGTKRRDRRYHMHLQKTLRVLFNTRLGMWSPK